MLLSTTAKEKTKGKDARLFRVLSRMESLQRERQPLEGDWEEIADYYWPTFERDTLRSDGRPRQDKGREVYDSVGMNVLTMFTDALHGNIMSRSAAWFKLEPRNRELLKDNAINKWLQKASASIATSLQQSLFYTEAHPVIKSWSSFGHGILMKLKRVADKRIDFMFVPIGRAWFAEDEFGRVDTMFREIWMTLDTIVDKWGEDKLSKEQRKVYDEAPYEKVRVIHATIPASDLRGEKHKGKWVSMYIDVDDPRVLFEEDIDTFDFAVVRNQKCGDHAYAESPCHLTLHDSRILQIMGRDMLDATELANKGIGIGVNASGIGRPADRTPGSNIWLAPGESFDIKYPSGNFGAAQKEQVERRQQLRQAFSLDAFFTMTSSERAMTMYEASQRVQEKSTVLAPRMGRLKPELLDVVLQWQYENELKSGRLEPPPIPEGTEIELDISYLDQLGQAQARMFAAGGLQGFLAAILPLALQVPEWRAMLDKYNPDDLADAFADMFTAPQAIERSEQEVEGIRKARAEQQKAAMQAELQSKNADAASKIGQAQKASAEAAAIAPGQANQQPARRRAQ